MSFLLRIKKIGDLSNKARVFFNPKAANYWHTITPCNITEKPAEIGPYYLDFRSKVNYVQAFDEQGVPLFKYLNEIPKTYHPIAISQYALGLYDVLRDKNFDDNEIKHKFLSQANWLKNNFVEKDDGAFWLFDYPDKRYKIKPKWCSAMAQGEAISVLCRAYKLTNENEYLDTAESALLPFYLDIDEGGVLNLFNDIKIYEEFPAGEVTGVLNGFIFSLFGLYDLIMTNQNKKALQLFKEGLNSIELLLKYFDLGYWSRYDLYKYPLENPASFTYHSLHVEQLKALYILSGQKIFKEYSERWEVFAGSFFNKTKALIKKIFYLKKIKAI